MATIALFHSVLGVRPGVLEAADTLRGAGHEVVVVDQYDGRTFDDYTEASAYADETVGMVTLTAQALDAVAGQPDDLVVAGFSNGAGMAQWIATHRPVGAAVLLSGIIPLPFFAELEAGLVWPTGVPVQSHYMRGDPFLHEGAVEGFAADVEAAGSALEHHWYEGAAHLFTDQSRPDEYDAAAAALLWNRTLGFLAALPSEPPPT